MPDTAVEWFFCNSCSRKTKHFIRAEFEQTIDHPAFTLKYRMLVTECCGCENLSFVKLSQDSDDYELAVDAETGEETAIWREQIYPPVNFRNPPDWFEDLPDEVMRQISGEIYKSLQSGSNYLATFGSRTLIDRLIVLTVGDKGNFGKGLKALQEEGLVSQNERNILKPVIDAGNAAAHRGWAPSEEQIKVILDTVEGLIHRLLVLPKLSEELEEAVPSRNGKDTAKSTPAKAVNTVSMSEKLRSAPDDVRELYDQVTSELKALGDDITIHQKKHYVAYRHHRNFASVQVYNRNRVVKAYLNLDPDEYEIDGSYMRDVRQIGHYGTGDLEITMSSVDDIEKAAPLFEQSYQQS